MNPSKGHNNWLTVGEIINAIKKPIVLYTGQTVKKWHEQLSLRDCSAYGPCNNPADCQTKKKSKDLCDSCKKWCKKLESSHRNGIKTQIKWRQNCDTSKWSSDDWEVAKFFMSPLGDNKSTVKDADSTDLSSLLNVLEWMKDGAFGADRRVDLNFVKQLRSEVRNTWAHAPNQEMTAEQLDKAFEVAKNFLDDLEQVFTCEEVKKCQEKSQYLQDNGVTNIAEAELKNLLFLREELQKEMKSLEKHNEMLKNLESYMKQCSERIDNLEKWKIKHDKGKQVKICIPEKLPTFTGREKEVKQIISLISGEEDSHEEDNHEKDSHKNRLGIVSIIGGPGFGKSTIAVEVSHQLNENYNIPVIFSYLSNALTVDEVVRRLCLDIGIHPGEDPMSTLIVWLRSIEEKTVLVMDNIEQLQESKAEKVNFTALLRDLRKDSQNILQIIVTSTKSLTINGLEIKECSVKEMEPESSIKLLKKCCPEKEFQDNNLQEMVELCGHVPLALRLLASQLKTTDDPAEVITWLKDTPMDVLQTPDASIKVRNTIQKSFELLNDEDKKRFVRLSVFAGNFSREAAKHVTELLNDIQTENVLSGFVARSLLQKSGKDYSIHRLIKCFLTESKTFEDEQEQAKQLMLEHFLTKCYDLTKMYWQKDGSNAARNALKEDSHNIEAVLKRLCEEAAEDIGESKMVDTLVKSDIYASSPARFFYNSILHILSPTVVRNFLQSCVEVGKAKEDFASVVNFQCLVADEERRRSWDSEEYKDSIESAKQNFEENKEKLEQNNDVKSHFFYCYGRYLCGEATNLKNLSKAKKLEIFSKAKKHAQKSLELRSIPKDIQSPMDDVDQIISLHLLGQINKKMKSDGAKENFVKAIKMSKESLGDHELTASSYKKLGDSHFTRFDNNEALKCYREAARIHKTLGLTNSSVDSVYLLKNHGGCLLFMKQYEDAAHILKEACDLVKKLPSDAVPADTRSWLYSQYAITLDKLGSDCELAAEYAKKAIELKRCNIRKMEAIVAKKFAKARRN